jgi:hypothetical protein
MFRTSGCNRGAKRPNSWRDRRVSLRRGGGISPPELSSFFGEQTGLAPVEGGDFLSDRLWRREISHEGDYFLMRFVDLDQRRAFRAGAFDGATAINIRIERRMPWAFAAPSDAADLQHWFYSSRSLPRNAMLPHLISSAATAQKALLTALRCCSQGKACSIRVAQGMHLREP